MTQRELLTRCSLACQARVPADLLSACTVFNVASKDTFNFQASGVNSFTKQAFIVDALPVLTEGPDRELIPAHAAVLHTLRLLCRE
jgi:hypothetical protein